MKPWTLLSLLLASSPLASANGGGYFRGGTENTGDLTGFQPEHTEKIRMVDEKLTVDLGNKEAAVDIRYVMKNETDKTVKVRFGFPVEESFDDDLNEDRSPVQNGGKGAKAKLKYCQDYVITAGGKKVAAEWKAEEKKPNQDDEFRGIAGWLVSEVRFAPGQEIPVTINFTSTYPFEESSVSDDSHTGPGIFKYRLSSAACWAGTIGTGKIVLRPKGIDPAELKVLKPVNRFKKSGDEWVWEFTDLEPTLADDLQVEARPEEQSFNSGEYTERGGKWSVMHANYTITASSTLPPSKDHDYRPQNVKEPWGQKAWSEGAPGSGAGEWLELKPEVPKPLLSIHIHPGYWKETYGENVNLFTANARPKKIHVELNGEHRFNVDVPDEREVFRIPITGYTKPVKTVKLTFLEVYKGEFYEDLCLSGIRLSVRLDKKPKVQHAR